MSWVDEFFDEPTYDLEYEAVLADGERTAREADFIFRELGLKEGSRVLDLCCGHGRHALSIAPRVASVVGYDRTERFIEHARARAGELGVANAEFVTGDMRRLNYDAEFDGAWNYFTAWGYHSDEENLDVLRRVARALKPGARFLIELIGRDALMRRYKAREWKCLSDGTVVLSEHRFDEPTGRNYSVRTYIRPLGAGRKTIEIDHHIPTPDGLAALLREAGLADVRLMSAPDGGEITMDTFRIAASAARP